MTMRCLGFALWVWCSVACVGAQDGAEPAAGATRAVPSEAGRTALAAGREQIGSLRGLRGPERKAALEQVATAHDRIAAQFAAEPVVAAAAAFAAAELWRQQGSLALAEQAYLRAAALDAPRFAQRGLLGAADMQRRQQRAEAALATYAKAEAVESGSARAQQARLWRGRVLQGLGRLDEAVTVFQFALECAEGPMQVIETANLLALAWLEAGDLEAAARAIEHAERAVEAAADEDPATAERQHKALDGMSARKALQRARDQRDGAAKDAVEFDAAQRGAVR
jgi:tetratricopeptide (TPR) repeat protein